ncbi:ankyrin repeat-containing domain protein, partial [Powellomyces hirtus]
ACVGHVDACRGLIDGGARLPTAWRRPLEPVFERDSRDVLALLLDRGLYTLDCPDGKETIYDIEKHGSWDILGMYLARGWNHRQDYTTLDAAAVQRGELGNLKQLMELGVCPYGDLLIEAALSGHTEIVMYLLEDQEWNPQWADEYDRDVLEIAASCGDVDMLAALLERGVHRYPEERWSIHAAMVQAQHYRNLDMVRLMVTHGYYDMTFEAGDEVLEWAVEHGDVELVEFLLDAGAGVQPVLGRALRVAIELGKSDMERALRRLCDEPVDGSTASPPPSDYLEDPEWWGTDWRLRRGPQKPLSYRRLDIRP